MENKKQIPTDRFMKVYSKLPLEERDQPILIIEDEPVSWKMAYREIINRTKLGEKIIKKLVEMNII